MPPKKFKKWHWNALKDYCTGVRLREISDKYKCHDGTIAVIAKSVGIDPRPTGFASYQIAHKWVTKATADYERLISNGTSTPIS